MLLFASFAETRYLATKSKLRDVSVEGGLLSASSALMVGNSVKYFGYTLSFQHQHYPTENGSWI